EHPPAPHGTDQTRHEEPDLVAIAWKCRRGDPGPRRAIVVGTPELAQDIGQDRRRKVLVADLEPSRAALPPERLHEWARALLEKTDRPPRRPLSAEAALEPGAIE